MPAIDDFFLGHGRLNLTVLGMYPVLNVLIRHEPLQNVWGQNPPRQDFKAPRYLK